MTDVDLIAEIRDERAALSNDTSRRHHTSPLVDQPWALVFLGIVVAGGVYPVVFVGIQLVWEFVEMLMPGSQAAPLENSLVFAALAAVTGSFVGMIWAGIVAAVTMPLYRLFVRSLNWQPDLVTFGATCGGLVGFVAVIPVMGVASYRWPDTSFEWLTAIALGPALTTVLGQLGGARGASRTQVYASDSGEADELDAMRGVRFRFTIRQMLWLSFWLSMLLMGIRLLQVPFEVALPLVFGWLAFQAITLQIGRLIVWYLRQRWWPAPSNRFT